MGINKRDLLTIIIISIVFFSMAAWNLGLTQAPTTTWQTSRDQSFYINIGRTENIGTVYLLVKNGSATAQAYIGSPGNWNSQGILPLSITYPYDYYSWSKITIESSTQYVRFQFENATVEVAELSVLDQDNQKIPIVAIVGENESSQDLPSLIDEQDLVECPPTYMSETFFDEIYYVKTAENYLKLEYPYEWTHPPLGKLIIAFGIFAFGYSPFIWRIMGVLFATLMLPIIYLLGKNLLGTWIGAFTSAFLLAFDFMHFTMARMATVDTYVVFFSLVSQLFFLIYIKDVFKNGWKASIIPLFLGFLFFALGFSTKWFVLYGFIGLIAFLMILRLRDVTKLREAWAVKLSALLDPPFYLLPLFLLTAILIYFLTFIPDMIVGRSAVDVLGLQGSMYIYHSTLSATHPFSSAWWSWPFMLRPVWLYVSYLPLDVKSTITLLGNPAVWWSGFISILIVMVKAVPSRFMKKLPKLEILARNQPSVEWIALFIAVVFFFQWVPYVFISRITFIYHYYLNVPLLCLASAYLVSKCWSSKLGKIATVALLAAVVILFTLFYPVISGMPSSTTSIENLKWFESWVF